MSASMSWVSSKPPMTSAGCRLAIAGAGGGLATSGTVVILENSTVSHNSSAFGGGISQDYGTLTITGSAILRNTSSGLGGGVVESSPEDVDGRKVSSSFLYNATLAMFEAEGFTRVRQLGKNSWLVSKRVRARRATG